MVFSSLRRHPTSGKTYLSPFARPWDVPGAILVEVSDIGVCTSLLPTDGQSVVLVEAKDRAVSRLNRDRALFRRAPHPGPTSIMRVQGTLNIAVRQLFALGLHGKARTILAIGESL